MEGGGGGVRGEREAYLKNAKITPDLQHYEEKRVDTADNLEEMSYLSEWLKWLGATHMIPKSSLFWNEFIPSPCISL